MVFFFPDGSTMFHDKTDTKNNAKFVSERFSKHEKSSWYLSELAKLPDLDARVIMVWFERKVRKEKPLPDLSGMFLEEEKKKL